MMTAKKLKDFFSQFPDDIPIIIGECYECDIEGFSYSTSDRVVKLKLTDGYGIVTNEFIDSLFETLKSRSSL